MRKVPRSLLPLMLAALWCQPVAGDDYVCSEEDGCEALPPGDGPTVKFRKGDVVSTDRGWVVIQANGWVELDF